MKKFLRSALLIVVLVGSFSIDTQLHANCTCEDMDCYYNEDIGKCATPYWQWACAVICPPDEN